MRALVLALTLCIAPPAFAIPIEHYQLTYEIFDRDGQPDILPSAFGDLSVGARLSVDLCWNPDADPSADSPFQFPEAVCGYSIQLGEYLAQLVTPNHVQMTSHGGSSIFYVDEAPQLTGPDASSWHLDIFQFSLSCSSYAGEGLPKHLDKCATNDISSRLAVGPLTHPNGFPCTADCGAGGSVFADLVGIRRVAVPEPSAAALLMLGLLALLGVGRRGKTGLRQ